MRQMEKALLMALTLTVLAFASSCSSETGKPGKATAQNQLFAPIKDCAFSLEVVTPETEYFRGDVAPVITFRLRNIGLKPVTVYEWMVKEQDNIKITYARCDSSPDRIPPSEWKTYEPKMKDPVPRQPLDLYPKNMALINVELSFIKDALASNSTKDRVSYAVVGELNLKSVSAKSKPFIVTFK